MALTESDLLASLQGLLAQTEQLRADTPLFSSGLLDSVAMINLIALVEQRAGIQIAAHEVTLDSFDSADRILAFVAKHG